MEWHHCYADLRLVFLKQFLSGVWLVEGFAAGIFTRPGMIAPDDHVRTTAVFSNNSMPNRLPRSRHAHGKRQEGKFRGATRILRQNCLKTSDAREIINVTGLGHSHCRMNQQTRFSLSTRTESQFNMGPMHRVARLK